MMDYAKQYGQMHAANPKAFSGYSIKFHVGTIADLVHRVQPQRILDYGSGKGYQYLARRVHQRWGGLLPHCYDPGVPQLRERPHGKFQGVICTDVMEHIEEADVPDVLADIFSFVDPTAHAFAFFCIACRPAKRKRLPDGRDVHVTIRAPDWWRGRLAKFHRTGLITWTEFDEG